MTLALDPPRATAQSLRRMQAAVDDRRLPVRLLGVWLALLLLVPDRFTLPQGANVAVRPHHAVLGLLLVVVARRFSQGEAMRFGPAVVALLLPAVSAVSVVQNLGRLAPDETAAGMRALGEIAMLALVVLLTVAVAPDRRHRRQLVVVVVVALTIAAGLGIWEAATGQRALDGLDDVVPILGVETFSATGARAAEPFVDADLPFQDRLGMNRITGASRHAIEFSVVMCTGMVLALALSARTWHAGRRLLLRAAAGAMAIALPLALARSGAVAVAVVGVVVVAVAGRGRRLRAALATGGAGLVLLAAAMVFQPQATNGLVEVFLSSREDSSVAARTSDYGEIDRAVGTAPWLGRGIGQWESYRTPFDRQLLFDNQYLLSAEETGVIGVLAFGAVLAVAIAVAGRWVRCGGPERALAVGTLGLVVAFAVVSATFDALYFSQAASLFMFLFGLACTADLEARETRASE